nr:MAG TPA: hypothetical protein [Caudoviricetes sp.]
MCSWCFPPVCFCYFLKLDLIISRFEIYVNNFLSLFEIFLFIFLSHWYIIKKKGVN